MDVEHILKFGRWMFPYTFQTIQQNAAEWKVQEVIPSLEPMPSKRGRRFSVIQRFWEGHRTVGTVETVGTVVTIGSVETDLCEQSL